MKSLLTLGTCRQHSRGSRILREEKEKASCGIDRILGAAQKTLIKVPSQYRLNNFCLSIVSREELVTRSPDNDLTLSASSSFSHQKKK